VTVHLAQIPPGQSEHFELIPEFWDATALPNTIRVAVRCCDKRLMRNHDRVVRLDYYVLFDMLTLNDGRVVER
jgi:hypothetical protein